MTKTPEGLSVYEKSKGVHNKNSTGNLQIIICSVDDVLKQMLDSMVLLFTIRLNENDVKSNYVEVKLIASSKNVRVIGPS